MALRYQSFYLYSQSEKNRFIQYFSIGNEKLMHESCSQHKWMKTARLKETDEGKKMRRNTERSIKRAL